ncbi:MAG: hypothetical protein AB7G75_04490 [Candidatus Binatia bacterium]
MSRHLSQRLSLQTRLDLQTPPPSIERLQKNARRHCELERKVLMRPWPSRLSTRVFVGVAFLLLTLISPVAFSQAADTVPRSFHELFDYSLKEKKGLTFFVHGQTIPGIVTKIIGDEAVEVRNQTSDRIIIRLDHIDAVAAN